MDAENTSKTVRKHWADAYAGAPDYIHTDAGTNFNSV